MPVESEKLLVAACEENRWMWPEYLVPKLLFLPLFRPLSPHSEISDKKSCASCLEYNPLLLLITDVGLFIKCSALDESQTQAALWDIMSNCDVIAV